MTEPADLDAGRRRRAVSERRFNLCGYTFTRRMEVPLGVLLDFAENTGGVTAGPDTPQMIQAFISTFHAIVNDTAVEIATGDEVPTQDAWTQITTIGDDLGPIGAETLAEIVQHLVSGMTETPTLELPDSSGGSPIPVTGTPPTPPLSSEAQPDSMPLTPVAP